MPERFSKSKLVPKDIGNPKGVLADRFLPDGKTLLPAETPYILGTIMGIARSVRSRPMPNGDVYEMIIGEFEGVSAANGDITNSTVLYLPGGIHEQLANPLKAEDAQPIEFAIQLATRRTGNPAGYEWIVKNLITPTVADPLAKIREQVAATKPPALTAPVSDDKGLVKKDDKTKAA